MPQTAKMRLFQTADRETLVAEDSPEAAFLYAGVGDEIPDSAAELYGLVDGALPGHSDDDAKPKGGKGGKGGATKQAPAPADKAAADKAAADKAAADKAAADKAAADAAANQAAGA